MMELFTIRGWLFLVLLLLSLGVFLLQRVLANTEILKSDNVELGRMLKKALGQEN